MCRAVTCKKCGKTTWAGCGQHVNEVMRGVPSAQRCRGHEHDTPAVKTPNSGFFTRLFSR